MRFANGLGAHYWMPDLPNGGSTQAGPGGPCLAQRLCPHALEVAGDAVYLGI